jgi:ribosomal protein L7/L12
MIDNQTVTREQYLTFLASANRTVELFMDFTYDHAQARSSYRKINHIKHFKAFHGTSLKLAKDVVDVAFDCWKNEHPLPESANDQALEALRDKLTGNRNQF